MNQRKEIVNEVDEPMIRGRAARPEGAPGEDRALAGQEAGIGSPQVQPGPV